MGSQNIDLVPPQRLDNGLNSQMVFQDENLQFSRPPDRKMFSSDRERFFREDFQRNVYDSVAPRRDPPPSRQDWNGDGSTGTQEDDEDEDDDDDEDEEDEGEEDGEGDGEVEGFVAVDVGIKSNSNTNNNNSSGSVQSSSEKIRNENASVQKNHSFGLNRLLMKDSGIVHSGNSIRGGLSEKQHQQGSVGHYENAITIAEPNIYYAQMLQGSDGSVLAQKEAGGENGCGFSGRKYVSLSIESGESLRAILSDPITGTLMDDAMILVCGHSFGSGGMQHVMRMKSCYTCGHSISEDSVAPNLALRSAVQAFRREEELLSSRAPKRRRDRFEQDNCSYGDPVDSSRGKGVQFPFVVTDRVIIKGNKRTPQRFVGREAVVTTQCLNGWYVVKTLDNAESVKLQYRSLAKVPDSRTADVMPSKTIVPNWL